MSRAFTDGFKYVRFVYGNTGKSMTCHRRILSRQPDTAKIIEDKIAADHIWRIVCEHQMGRMLAI